MGIEQREDNFGVGQLANGDFAVIPEKDFAQWRDKRDADEATNDITDISDLEDLDKLFAHTVDERSSTAVALTMAQRLDRLGYFKGLHQITFESDRDKWNARYEYERDTIVVQAKFENKGFLDKVQTFLHEAGHRGQLRVDPSTYESFKHAGLNTEKNFLAMANQVHREDYARNGINNLAEEAFAESYARFCLGLEMPTTIKVFWQQRTKERTS